jgi:von Willebrand factor type A domain
MKVSDFLRTKQPTTRPDARTLLASLIACVCFLATALQGESDACLSRTALIGVSGTKGERPEGFTAADFKVTVGGKAVSVQSVAPASKPPRVIILLDASANHDQQTWAVTQALVEEFLAGFPDAGDFNLVTFDDKVQRVVHVTDRSSLQGTVAELFPSGKRESEAGIAEAVKKGSAAFDPYREGDTEFLVTTSDQIQKETAQALSLQRAAGIRLFGASFDQTIRSGPLPFDVYMSVETRSPLDTAARASGGLWIWFDMSRQDTATLLRNAATAGKSTAALVSNFVALQLQLTSLITKPEKLKIELVKDARGKTEDRFAAYPRELFPCQ